MPRYKMQIAYDGTGLGGWQIQNNAPTVQQEIEKALATALREKTSLHGAGRTDAGVHAEGQVAHFDVQSTLDTDKVLYSLNALLCKQIRIFTLEEVDVSFHARFSAKAKQYNYRLTTGSFLDPFLLKYAWHIPQPLDIQAVEQAKKHVLGTHDFRSFANEADRGSAGKNAIRTLESLDIESHGHHIQLVFTGNGFLYKMVRNITGALVEVGLGKKKAEDIAVILAGKDRRLAGAAAPAHGLVLARVFY